jgi:hypothetical protein
MIAKPDRTEAADYYFTYINQVPGTDICRILEEQLSEAREFLPAIPEDQSLHRYAEGKWSMRQLLSHVTDTERAFVFRALWFARRFDSPLPGFDQDIAVAGADADSRSWASHIEEFQAVRQATLALFGNLSENMWDRRGVASGNPFTVRALAFISAGHVAHHMKILRERYL